MQSRKVKNLQPQLEPQGMRIAIIGEAPGQDEENHGYPFVGPSGRFLNMRLDGAGIDRRRCLVANVCQVRPPQNRIATFPWDGSEIQEGLAQLKEDIQTYDPNICLLLGGTALRAGLGRAEKITDWRGSLFTGDMGGVLSGRKCISSLHPAAVLREYSGDPLLRFDLGRAASESRSRDLILPQRQLLTDLSASVLCDIMDGWPAGLRCSLDIEGGLHVGAVHESVRRDADNAGRLGWPCVSICSDPLKSITIAWGRLSPTEHPRVLRSFARLMWRTDVPKVLQNSLYDNFVLSFGYRIPIRNVTEDTLIKGWEIYAELPRALGVQTSIWTREPYYKSDRKSPDKEKFFQYCAKDSAVTLEICNAQDSVLSGSGLRHYHQMMQMLNPFHFMEHRGIRYNLEAVKRRREETQTTILAVGEQLNSLASEELRGKKGSLSAKRLAKYMYEKAGYPPQFKKDFDDNGNRINKLTTDNEALLNLKKQRPDDLFLSSVLRHRHLEGVRETLAIEADPDGRVRCGYSLEAETGRVKCYTSPTGAGSNLQTIQSFLRDNYSADPGHEFFQADLEGADGWTVAARAKSLGDDTMFEDYRAGMKPAKIIALLYHFGNIINQLPRDILKWYHDRVFPIVLKEHGKWLYMGSKRVQHGSSYLMGIPTMQLNVLRDSFKESGVPEYMDYQAANFLQQSCFFSRYPGIKTWHGWAKSQLCASGTLTPASGRTRIFFGRRTGTDQDIKDTLKEYLAHEPQDNTTWATNLAMLNLWNDPENRVCYRNGSLVRTLSGFEFVLPWVNAADYTRLVPGALVIEPLHQVHDALCGQWPTFLRDWARAKVRSYFNNTLTIAGIDLVIPFDGKFGPSWGEQPHKL